MQEDHSLDEEHSPPLSTLPADKKDRPRDKWHQSCCKKKKQNSAVVGYLQLTKTFLLLCTAIFSEGLLGISFVSQGNHLLEGNAHTHAHIHKTKVEVKPLVTCMCTSSSYSLALATTCSTIFTSISPLSPHSLPSVPFSLIRQTSTKSRYLVILCMGLRRWLPRGSTSPTPCWIACNKDTRQTLTRHVPFSHYL